MNPEIEKKIDAVFVTRSQRLTKETQKANEFKNQQAIFEQEFKALIDSTIFPACSEFAEYLKTKGWKSEVVKGHPSDNTPKAQWQGDIVNFFIQSADDHFPFEEKFFNMMPRVSFESDLEKLKIRIVQKATSINGSPGINETNYANLQPLKAADIQEILIRFSTQLIR